MQIQANPYTARGNQCPHGMPMNACAACSGGGGGSGSAGKKSTAGLMSWGEAWATWNAIRTAKTREGDYLKGLDLNNLRREREPLLMASTMGSGVSTLPIFQSLTRLLSTLFNPQQRQPLAADGKPMPLGATILIENVAERLEALTKASYQRISTLLFDMQALVLQGLRNNLEMIKSWIIQLKWDTLTEQIRDVLKRLVSPKSIQKRLKNFKESVWALIAAVDRLIQGQSRNSNGDA